MWKSASKCGTHGKLSSRIPLGHQINHGFAVHLVVITVELGVGVDAGAVVLRILVVLIEIRHLDEGREFLINLIKPFLTEGDGRIRRRLSHLQTARNELENVNWLRQRKGKKKKILSLMGIARRW